MKLLYGAHSSAAFKFGQSHPASALELHDAISVEQIFKIIKLVGMPLEADRQDHFGDRKDLALEDIDQLDDIAPLLVVSFHRADQQLALN